MKLFYTLLLSTLLFISCKKKEITYGEFDVYHGGQALLKLNFVSPFATSKTVQFKLNEQRYGALISYRYPYPGGGYNTNGASSPEYMQVTPGAYDFSITVPNAGTSNDSLVLLTGKIALEAGKNYSLHITDTANAIKHLLVIDDVSKPAAGTARYKLVNLIPNVSGVDLYLGDSLVQKNINYLSSSEYFVLNIPQATTRAWNVRVAGSLPTSTVLATYTSTSTFTNQRVYTIFTLGYSGKTSTSQKPYVSLFLEN